MSGKPLSKVAELPVKRINIEKLDFDLDNARFLPNVKMTSEKAYKMLRKIGNIDDLIKQIISSEGITDPLLVLKIGSRFVVKEGNRRLAACKYVIENPNKLNFEKLIQGNIKNIPCKIVPRGYKEIDIRLLLLTIHIRAKQDWRLFNRAHYIVELNKKFGKTSDEIAYYGVMSKSTVTKTIRSYERTIEYKNKYPKDESWSTKYTYFYQLYTSKNLEAFRDVKSNIYKFSTWVYNKKFKDYQDIRDLYKILNNEKASSFLKIRLEHMEDWYKFQ